MLPDRVGVDGDAIVLPNEGPGFVILAQTPEDLSVIQVPLDDVSLDFLPADHDGTVKDDQDMGCGIAVGLGLLADQLPVCSEDLGDIGVEAVDYVVLVGCTFRAGRFERGPCLFGCELAGIECQGHEDHVRVPETSVPRNRFVDDCLVDGLGNLVADFPFLDGILEVPPFSHWDVDELVGFVVVKLVALLFFDVV